MPSMNRKKERSKLSREYKKEEDTLFAPSCFHFGECDEILMAQLYKSLKQA